MHMLVNNEVIASGFVCNHGVPSSSVAVEIFAMISSTYNTRSSNTVKRSAVGPDHVRPGCLRGLTEELELD
jgi:hypothetical protein